MTLFNRREQSSEQSFLQKQKHKFKVDARRNKLLGLWAAQLLGKTGKDADDYYLEVVKCEMEEAGDDDVFRKVKQDFISAGVELSDSDLRERMEVLRTEAETQIENESKA